MTDQRPNRPDEDENLDGTQADGWEPDATLPGDANADQSQASQADRDDDLEATLPGDWQEEQPISSAQSAPQATDSDEEVEPDATLPGHSEAPLETSASGSMDDADATLPPDGFDESAEPDETLPGLADDAAASAEEPEATLAGTEEVEASTPAGPDDFGGATYIGTEAPADASEEPDVEATMAVHSASDIAADDDQAMATFVAPIPGVDPRDAGIGIPSDTENMTYVPDFADENDDLMKTQQADPTLLEKISKGELDENEIDATAKTFNPSKAPTEQSVGGSMAASWLGKSAWDLRIHRRDVLGELTGVPNDIPSSMDDAEGLATALVDDRMVSDYEIVDELGAGNMGVVYRAKQTSLNRDLAIKTLKPRAEKKGSTKVGTKQQEYEQEMFVSEAVVTANLVHPNIVPIHDLARNADGKLFYAMKCVTGTPWNKTIRKQGNLEEKLDILMKVCDAVAYAHSRGVINRDLKPENVVVGEYGEVMVLDWGLAVTTERFEKKGSVLTDVRGGAGTPVYMPPELFDRDIRRIGYHSDIYLLGAMLFEVLEGFPPHYLRKLWKRESGTGKFNAIVMAVINNEIETDVTECELMNIARKAMATNPEDRHTDVEDFQNAIREYRITGRAEELLQEIETDPPNDYSRHQAAVALFEEARTKWPENQRALDGERQARLAYASLAVGKSDLDLASQVVDQQEGAEFDTIRQQVRTARRRQTLAKTALITFMIATLGFGGYSYAAKQALIKKDARLAQVDEEIDAANQKKELADREAAQALAKAAEAADEAAIAEAEAVKAKGEAQLALDEANKAKADAAVAELAAKKASDEAKVAQADAMRASAEAKVAKQETMVAEAEAVAAKKDAEEALAEAKVAEKAAAAAKMELTVAQKSAADAQQEAKTAQMQAQVAQVAATEAKAEATRVRKEAEVAVAKLTTESEMLNKQIAVAKVEQQELQEEVYRSEYRVHKRFIDAFAELGEYGNAVRQINKALADTDNIEIQKRADHLRRWKQELERKTGSSEVTWDDSVERAAIGPGGSTLALFGQATDGSRTLKVVDNGRVASVPNPARGLDSFAFSHDGNTLVGVGGEVVQVWGRVAKGWRELEVAKPADATPIDAFKAIFVQGGKSLLIVGQDRNAPIDAYRISDTEVNFAKQLNLAGDIDADYSLLGVAIDPDEQFLIASTRRQSCRAFPLTWSKGVPQVERTGPNAVPVRLPIRPDHVVISNDGQFLAVAEGRDVIVLPRNEDKKEKAFPFLSPRTAAATVARTQIAIADMAFSSDSQRLVAGLDEKFVQIWDRSGLRFLRSEVDGLYKSKYLAGHSGGLKHVAFVGDAHDTIVSIGSDNAMRIWRVDDYADYVRHFEELPQILNGPATVTLKSGSQPKLRELEEVGLRRDTATTFRFDRPKSQHVDAPRREKHSTTPIGLIETQPVALEDSPTRERPIRFRQGRTAFSARLSDDGSRVIVGADDRAAHVFRTDSGRGTLQGSQFGRLSLFFDPARNAFLEGHIPQLSAVEFLPPNGEYLLTEDYFGSISVWDARDDQNGIGFEVSRLLSEYSLSEFATSQDGQFVIAGGAEIITNESSKATLRHFGLIWSLDAIQSSPTPLATHRLEGQHPNAPITAVALSPDNKLAITAGRRGRIVVWDLASGDVVASIATSHGSDQVSGVAFLDNSSFVTTGYDGKAYRWVIRDDELDSTQIDRTLPDNQKVTFIMRLRKSPADDRWLTSEIISTRVGESQSDQTQSLQITAWDGDAHSVIYSVDVPPQSPEMPFRHDVGWSHNGRKAFVVRDGELTIFDTEEWARLRTVSDSTGRTVRAAFSPHDSDQVALFDGEVTHLWNLEESREITEFRSHANVFAAAFSADRKFVATGSDSIRIFNADEKSRGHGQTLARARTAVPSPVIDVAFSPIAGDYRLATANRLGDISVWDWTPANVAMRSPMIALAPPIDAENPSTDPGGSQSDDQSRSHRLCWSPDGRSLAAVRFGRPHLWRINGGSATEVPLPIDADREFSANDVAWSPAGDLLVYGGIGRPSDQADADSMGIVLTGSEDAPKVIGVFAGQHEADPLLALLGESGITAIAVDPLGDILTGGDRGEIVRWGAFGDPASGIEIEPFGQITLDDGRRPHDGFVTSIDVGPQGQTVSSGSNGWVVVRP